MSGGPTRRTDVACRAALAHGLLGGVVRPPTPRSRAGCSPNCSRSPRNRSGRSSRRVQPGRLGPPSESATASCPRRPAGDQPAGRRVQAGCTYAAHAASAPSYSVAVARSSSHGSGRRGIFINMEKKVVIYRVEHRTSPSRTGWPRRAQLCQIRSRRWLSSACHLASSARSTR
jgi:hypothetical protein